MTQVQSPDERARFVEAQMTDDERFQLLHGFIPLAVPGLPEFPASWTPCSGRIPGIERLGIPDLVETDASLGIINPFGLRKGDTATALPSGLAMAASFDPALAIETGALLGREAKSKGFNVLLGGGLNLTRDPWGGRNFEYLGEDPLLAGRMAGASVKGTQSEGVIATVKHFSLNTQETLRETLDARIDEAAHRASDLLAFELAIEEGKPGAVMGAYNKVNGTYACGCHHLLTQVLRDDWNYLGWVMSDWGAVHDVSYFANGLDQQSGAALDKQIWFDKPLRAEVEAGRVPRQRVSEAVQRIVRSIYAVGADRQGDAPPIDIPAHANTARKAATDGMVLLQNDGVLPLDADSRQRILVVGGHAHVGVLSGFGSSQVMPNCGVAASIPMSAPFGFATRSRQVLFASSPLRALQESMVNAKILYDSGYFAQTTAAHAANADLVIVFATQWSSEGLDTAGLMLPEGQDTLIASIAEANPNTIVVLQTGNPILMPWLSKVRAVVQAWYPGEMGGSAIADVLLGQVNPSGRLPITFPSSLTQAPRPHPPGLGAIEGTPAQVDYHEGAEVGYRYYRQQGHKPQFAFGHGLSYTRFEHSGFVVFQDRGTWIAQFVVTNVGSRTGADVPQVYLSAIGERPVLRLLGFEKVHLAAGEQRTLHIAMDNRLFCHWEQKTSGWRQSAGRYQIALAHHASDAGLTTTIELADAWISGRHPR